MPTEDRLSRRWFLHHKTETAFLVFLATAIAGAFCVRHIEYVGGERNSCGDGFLPSIALSGLLVPVSLGFIIWAIIQLFLPPHTLNRIFSRAAFLIAPPVILVAGFLISTPLATPFLRGFEKWVLREVDTDAIQRWLATEGRDYAGKQYESREGFPKELPDFLVRFRPRYITFRNSTSEGGLCVEFEWGGGFAHWGLTVGLPDMSTPEEGSIDLGGSETEFRRPIKPGVYVFERG